MLSSKQCLLAIQPIMSSYHSCGDETIYKEHQRVKHVGRTQIWVKFSHFKPNKSRIVLSDMASFSVVGRKTAQKLPHNKNSLETFLETYYQKAPLRQYWIKINLNETATFTWMPLISHSDAFTQTWCVQQWSNCERHGRGLRNMFAESIIGYRTAENTRESE